MSAVGIRNSTPDARRRRACLPHPSTDLPSSPTYLTEPLWSSSTRSTWHGLRYLSGPGSRSADPRCLAAAANLGFRARRCKCHETHGLLGFTSLARQSFLPNHELPTPGTLGLSLAPRSVGVRLFTDNTSLQARLVLVHGVLLRRVGEHVYDFLTRSLFWAGLRSRKRRGRGVFTERAVLSVPKVTTENDHDARASPRLVNSLVCLRQSTSHQYNVEGVSIREALGRLAVTQGCMSVHIHSWRFESTNDRSRQQALVLGFPALKIGSLLHQTFPPRFPTVQRLVTAVHDGTDFRHGQIRPAMSSRLKTLFLPARPAAAGNAALPILRGAPKCCVDETRASATCSGCANTSVAPSRLFRAAHGNRGAMSGMDPGALVMATLFPSRRCTQPSDSPISWNSHGGLSAPR